MARADRNERDRRRAARDAENNNAAMTPGPLAGAGPGQPDPPDAGDGFQLAREQDNAGDDARRVRVQKDRLNLTIEEDGSIDLGAMKTKTREKLLAAVARINGELPPPPRSDAPPPPPQDPEIGTDQCKTLLKAFGMIQTVVACRVWGVDAKTAAAIVPYSNDEVTALAPPLSKVLSKHSPDWLKKYWDEIQLALLFSTITGNKIAALNAAVNATGAPMKTGAPPPPPAPGPRPVDHNPKDDAIDANQPIARTSVAS